MYLLLIIAFISFLFSGIGFYIFAESYKAIYKILGIILCIIGFLFVILGTKGYTPQKNSELQDNNIIITLEKKDDIAENMVLVNKNYVESLEKDSLDLQNIHIELLEQLKELSIQQIDKITTDNNTITLNVNDGRTINIEIIEPD